MQRSTLKHVATPFHENRIAKPAMENEPQGQLQPIASKVLMKILFAARMARWDLLRATQGLASRVTKWSRDCDMALHRLVSYIASSLDVKMQGFIGDKIGGRKLWLFCDADWAGEFDSKSTSGCALFLVGPNTYYPLSAFSKKQTSITMSSTESEVISTNQGIRAQGLPSLSLWCFLWGEIVCKPTPQPRNLQEPIPILTKFDPELDEIRYGGAANGRSVANLNSLNVHLSPKFKVQLLEDNQATVTILLKGNSEKLRRTDKTQRISFAWLKQQFERGLFNMINVDTKEQVADIFTKPFTDRAKWENALSLIYHRNVGSSAKDSDNHLVAKPQVHATPADPSPLQRDAAYTKVFQDIEQLAHRLDEGQDYSPKALEQVAELLSLIKTKRNRQILKTNSQSFYRVFVAWTHGGCQGITGLTKKLPRVVQYVNNYIKQKAPPGFQHTSFVISRETQASIHRDSHNLAGSTNFITSFGQHTGGQLWLEDPDMAERHASFQDCNGERCKGQVVPTKNKAVCFSPQTRHCVLPWEGIRCSLTAYTTRSADDEYSSLIDFGFRPPPQPVDAASARLTGAMLLLFASLPCTGGSSWQRINVRNNPEKVELRKSLFRKLFRSFLSTIKLTRRHNPEIIFELPKTCDYWQDPSVVRFIERHGLTSHECDGCMVGIVDSNNLPLKKHGFSKPHSCCSALWPSGAHTRNTVKVEERL